MTADDSPIFFVAANRNGTSNQSLNCEEISASSWSMPGAVNSHGLTGTIGPWSMMGPHEDFIYGYGSIPINTIFRGMNIRLPAILMWTTGVQGFDTLPYVVDLPRKNGWIFHINHHFPTVFPWFSYQKVIFHRWNHWCFASPHLPMDPHGLEPQGIVQTQRQIRLLRIRLDPRNAGAWGGPTLW